MKYTNFSDWVNDVCDLFNIQLSDLNYGVHEYTFKVEQDLVAYWDREGKFGYVSVNDAV